MKCPNCKIEMTKGTLGSHGQVWSATERRRGGFWENLGIKSMQPLIAWKCPTCNKVELTTDVTTSPIRG